MRPTVGNKALSSHGSDSRPSRSSGGRRKAVIIGIKYEGHRWEDGKLCELEASHENALSIRNFLMNKHEYAKNDIVMLLDDDDRVSSTSPTRANIIKALEDLVCGAKDGDRFFVFYSGHGVQVKNLNGKERDGYDEVILCLDWKVKQGTEPAARDHYQNSIMDDALNEILTKNLHVGAHLVVLFDCCHSGTMMDLHYHRRVSASGGPLGLRHALREKHGMIRGNSEDSPEEGSDRANVISLSACLDAQQAWHHRKMGGMMTNAFVQSLTDKPRQNYRELIVDLTERLKRTCSAIEEPVQQPQLGFNNAPDLSAMVTF